MNLETKKLLSLLLLYLPIDRYRHQSEDTGANREDRDELTDLAVEHAEWPMAVQHVGVVEGDIQSGHHRVRDAEIYQEIVGDGAHPSMR